ncbi:TetR/AcrR family transcriptional regulator [Patiriisocius marinus]|uniref:TetR family transcriptional regulator n=1 Tax=Patiriisocius marinus TaxID=1397112 RepID=A0A5J4ITR8_9FLAO|nr:TetR/AcrR family transcriptional regulator [Patiriisocius marinus]GER58024.1 TetR family transcriptional regulator [Patiriisocius marinus]
MGITRKQEIIQIASRLFKERGYSAVSMRDIAQALDIKAASLYNHISGKQEILATLIIEVGEEFTSQMSQVMTASLNPIEKIEKVIEMHIDVTVNFPDNIATLNNDWMHLEGIALNRVVKMREDYEENFRKIIKLGISEGNIKSQHPEVILFSILSTLRTLYLWNEKRGKMDVNVLKKDMVSVLINGII